MRAPPDFGDLTAIDPTEEIALEALRLQNLPYDNGDPRPPQNLLIAASARSTGDHLVVADSDFLTSVLDDEIEITVKALLHGSQILGAIPS